jgi:hypothetical protein
VTVVGQGAARAGRLAGCVVARRVANRVIHRLVTAVGVVFNAGCDPRNFTVNCCRHWEFPFRRVSASGSADSGLTCPQMLYQGL